MNYKANFMKMKRIEKKMSLRALANELGVTHSFIHQVESGSRPLPARLEEAWSDIMGLDRDSMFWNLHEDISFCSDVDAELAVKLINKLSERPINKHMAGLIINALSTEQDLEKNDIRVLIDEMKETIHLLETSFSDESATEVAAYIKSIQTPLLVKRMATLASLGEIMLNGIVDATPNTV